MAWDERAAGLEPRRLGPADDGQAFHITDSSPQPKPDKAVMRAALDAMFDPDEVVELRALHKGRKRTDAGYFDGDHREALVNAAATLNAAGAAVYVNLNRIDPQLLGRCFNRVQDYAKATVTDKDVIRRRWLLIDFDPIRPTDTSATMTEYALRPDVLTLLKPDARPMSRWRTCSNACGVWSPRGRDAYLDWVDSNLAHSGAR